MDPHLFLLFGATGDLSKRLILPALVDLTRAHPDLKMRVLGVSRSEYDEAAFRDEAVKGMVEVGGLKKREATAWAKRHLHYVSLDGDPTPDDYERVKHYADHLADTHDLGPNRIHYLALPPAAFGMTAEWLGRTGMDGADGDGWVRLVVEKPFGHDLKSAQQLNALIHQHFDESQVYRIDHYLGKETVQNLLVFRLGNPVFERLWNREAIERVDIYVSEDLDVGTRGAYYDTAGAVRDMIQNHLTQLFTLVAMEVPAVPEADFVRAEKVKVLRSTAPIVGRDVVFGQYGAGRAGGADVPAYRSLRGVARGSDTETFAAIRLHVNNWRWQGVPFVLRTGKALKRRLTEVRVTFRSAPVAFFRGFDGCHLPPNTLRILIQPDEGFSLSFGVKRPGDGFVVEPHNFHFDYNEAFGEPPSAYRTLVEDLIRGDQTLFVHADEVEAAWALYDPILRRHRAVHPYAPGTWGPEAADKL
jgi:glucose-6-phosphate 1-dehydrogenase